MPRQPKKTARERGYVSREEACEGLRAVADRLQGTKKGAIGGLNALVKVGVKIDFLIEDSPAEVPADV